MLDLKYLPTHFTLFLILGIITGYYAHIEIPIIFILLIISSIGLIYLYLKSIKSFQSPIYFFILTGFIFLGFGILIINAHKPQNQKRHYVHKIMSENQIIFQLTKILNSNNFYNKYEAKMLQINDVNCNGKVLINVKKGSLKNGLKIDDVLFANCQLKIINKPQNPYGFDYQEYLKRQQINYQLTINKNDFIIVNAGQRTLKGIAHSIRVGINNKFHDANFNRDELAIMNALLLGQRTYISKEQFNQYKNAGAVHILAVSGLHIGIILLFLNFLFKPIDLLKKGKILKLILVLACLWFYAFLAGLSPSIIRSVTMFTAIALGLVSNRPFGIQYSLVISIFVLLLLYPLYIFNVGFQLSYTAVFSIIWLHPLLVKIWNPKFIVIEYFWNLFAITFAAQIGVLPLSLYYFHQFPGLFFVSSIVIIPFLGIILGTGFIIIILGVLNSIPHLLTDFYEFIIRTLNEFVAFISNQDIFIFQNISFSFVTMILLYLFLINLVIWFKNRSIHYLYLIFFTVFIFQSSLIYKKYELEKTNEFVIFHQSKKSIFANRLGTKMTFYQKLDAFQEGVYSPLKPYKLNFSNLSFYEKPHPKNVFTIDSKNILVIDSFAIYKEIDFNPEIVILTNSPKINLERMLQKLQPTTIIADGSNYRSLVNRWEKTCKNKSIEFYSTQKHGAFAYNY